MPSHRKRIGFLPSEDVHIIIEKISNDNNFSQSKVTGILVEEALRSRGFLDSSFSNNSSFIKNSLKDHQQNKKLSFYSDLKPNSAQYLHILAEALKYGHQNRSKFIGDPNFYDLNIDPFYSDSKIDEYVSECTVDEIFSRHFFEHLTFKQGRVVLEKWFKILKPQGKMHMMLPNLDFHINLDAKPYQAFK